MTSPSWIFLSTLLTEFRRAIAAAGRYEHLRYRGTSQERIAPADVARRIFLEFYACDRDDGVAQPDRRANRMAQAPQFLNDAVTRGA